MEKEEYKSSLNAAFVHGYVYAKAEEIKNTDKDFKDTPIPEIVSMILNNVIKNSKNAKEFLKEITVMPIVNGQHFHCECGANVFTKKSDTKYQCNACSLKYSSE